MHFQIHKAKDGQFYFTIVSRNGQPVAQSEMYKAKQSAMRTIKSIQRGVGACRIKDLSN